MKRKAIITILIILIIGCLGSGSYLYLNNSSKTNNQQNQEKEQENTNETINEEKDTNISEEEKLINKYLSYVPIRREDDFETYGYNTDAYSEKIITANELNENLFFENTFSLNKKQAPFEIYYPEQCGEKKCRGDEYYLAADVIDQIKKQYNLTLIPTEEIQTGGGALQLFDKYYIAFYGRGCYPIQKKSEISDYEYKGNTLIIYEKALFFIPDKEEFDSIINVFKTSKYDQNNIIDKFNIDETEEKYKSWEDVIDYFYTKNKENAQTYKHTFKQHEDGTYYWYSTEQI